MTFQHRAGVSPYTSPFGLAETCVFAKQSLGPLLCDLLSQVPLLPKLRGHFAEFLNNASLVGLRIFSSSTCVGLRYGYAYRNSGFSRQYGFRNFATILRSASHFTYRWRICLPSTALCLPGYFHSPVFLSSCVPTVLNMRSAGISTCYPSTTALALALGPDLPWEDQLYPGILRYSAYMILTYISLLIPAFLLLIGPRLLTLPLRPYRILLYPRYTLGVSCHSFGGVF